MVLRDGTEYGLRQMQREFSMNNLAAEDASHGLQRPNIEECGDTMFF